MEKYLTAFDTTGKLVVSEEWFAVLPHFEAGTYELQLPVTDGMGYYWQFYYAIRRRGNPRPFFQSPGWLRFVNVKGLEVGDKLILETYADDFIGTQFRIRSQKAFNNNGHWVDV